MQNPTLYFGHGPTFRASLYTKGLQSLFKKSCFHVNRKFVAKRCGEVKILFRHSIGTLVPGCEWVHHMAMLLVSAQIQVKCQVSIVEMKAHRRQESNAQRLNLKDAPTPTTFTWDDNKSIMTATYTKRSQGSKSSKWDVRLIMIILGREESLTLKCAMIRAT